MALEDRQVGSGPFTSSTSARPRPAISGRIGRICSTLSPAGSGDPRPGAAGRPTAADAELRVTARPGQSPPGRGDQDGRDDHRGGQEHERRQRRHRVPQQPGPPPRRSGSRQNGPWPAARTPTRRSLPVARQATAASRVLSVPNSIAGVDCHWQLRMPDLSYSSPALEVAPEDKERPSPRVDSSISSCSLHGGWARRQQATGKKTRCLTTRSSLRLAGAWRRLASRTRRHAVK